MTDQLKEALRAMNNKPVAYNPAYAALTGSVTGGILLSQLLYWAAAMDWKEFYKTNPELIKETGLSEDELRSAKKKVATYVEIVKKGTPCRTWYKLDIDRILANLSSTGKSPQLVPGNPRNQLREIPATIYTENNTENNYSNTPLRVEAAPGKQEEEKEKPTVAGSVVNDLLEAFKGINPDYKSFFANKTQRKAVEWLVKEYGEEAALKKIKFLKTHNSTKYATPTVTSPHELKRDMGKIEAFWSKEKTKNQGNSTGSVGRVNGLEAVKTPEGWRMKETGEVVQDQSVMTEEEYVREKNRLWAERTKACGKCRDGYRQTADGSEGLCECVRNLVVKKVHA